MHAIRWSNTLQRGIDWLLGSLFVLVILASAVDLIRATRWTYDLAALCVFVFWAYFLLSNKDQKWQRGIIRCSVLACTVILAIPMFFYPPGIPQNIKHTGGFWFDKTTGANTLTDNIVWTRPFSHDVSWVPLYQDQEMTFQVSSADNIPLSCSASTSGIRLDDRDPAALVNYLRSLVLLGNVPNSYLAMKISTTVSTAMRQAISETSADVLAIQERFYIPFHIGLRLTPVLSANHMMWREDAVMYASCNVSFREP
jgi:hypothetical protein